MSVIQDYLTLCCREQWQDGIFLHMYCEGDTLRLKPPQHTGIVCLPPVDSWEKGFCWSRLRVSAELPQDCSLRIYVHSADEPDWTDWTSLQSGELSQLRDCFGAPVCTGCDCWLSVSGRYLWIALELTATGSAMPCIHALSLRMGGDHMADYLPAIYQGDDFTRRYLSIFNSMLQDMEDTVEQLPRQLDPNSASEEMLPYLAQWLAVSPEEGAARERMCDTLRDYESMYTTDGVCRSVQRLTGRKPYIIEYFTVDSNRTDCSNPALYQRLYGNDPYRFFVLLGEDAFVSRERMEWFLTRMQDLIPAGMELELILLKQCVQLDWHTYLGINSRIGSYMPAVINETTTIHYDTTIGGATP